MIVIRNGKFPFGVYKALNLFGVVFVREDKVFKDYDYNHEHIHLKQMQEMLWVFYYIWYLVEYLILRVTGLFTGKSQREVYHCISLERETHDNEKNLDYVKTRKRYAWIGYLLKEKPL